MRRAVIALMLSGGQALEAFAGARARRELTALLARAPRAVHRYVSPYSVASIHALLDEQDEAMLWLEKAYAGRDRAMTYIQVNPRFDGLRDHPRFQDLVRRMAFPPAAMAGVEKEGVT